jgi:DNA-directed RNA polymerase specialized sigma subunit
MSGRILIIPTDLALDKRFSPRALRLWLLLQATARHKDEEGNLVCIRDRAEIANELGFSYVMVSNTLLDLQKAGWVKIDRIPGSHSRQMTIYETQQVQAQ